MSVYDWTAPVILETGIGIIAIDKPRGVGGNLYDLYQNGVKIGQFTLRSAAPPGHPCNGEFEYTFDFDYYCPLYSGDLLVLVDVINAKNGELYGFRQAIKWR